MVFFAWGAPVFIFILLLSCILDYTLALFICKVDFIHRKFLFFVGIIVNLLLLIYYKYTGFFVENFNSAMKLVFDGTILPEIDIVLPVGISFITFHKLSYLFDIYRKKTSVGNFVEYLLYILFFPKLLAGPILLWSNAYSQFTNLSNVTVNERLSGFIRFCLGIFKKVWLANVIGVELEHIFVTGFHEFSALTLWIALLAYSLQLLIDFSAYSDMAIGLAVMLGFQLPENFNNPYAATTIRDFWKRWHISLTAWFREYVFLPLAYRFSSILNKNYYFGLKTDYFIYIYAVIITFLLTGFWHGAAWTFILWGLYHGILLSIDRLFLYKWLRKVRFSVSFPVTVILVSFGWIIFKFTSFNEVITFIKHLFIFSGKTYHFQPIFIGALSIACIFSFLPLNEKFERFIKRWFSNETSDFMITMKIIISIILLTLAMAGVSSGGFNPFIYFRF